MDGIARFRNLRGQEVTQTVTIPAIGLVDHSSSIIVIDHSDKDISHTLETSYSAELASFMSTIAEKVPNMNTLFLRKEPCWKSRMLSHGPKFIAEHAVAFVPDATRLKSSKSITFLSVKKHLWEMTKSEDGTDFVSVQDRVKSWPVFLIPEFPSNEFRITNGDVSCAFDQPILVLPGNTSRIVCPVNGSLVRSSNLVLSVFIALPDADLLEHMMSKFPPSPLGVVGVAPAEPAPAWAVPLLAPRWNLKRISREKNIF